jgi:hypothetical protein
MLEEAIVQASGSFIKRLRAAYEEAEILSDGLRATEQQVVGLLDHQAANSEFHPGSSTRRYAYRSPTGSTSCRRTCARRWNRLPAR